MPFLRGNSPVCSVPAKLLPLGSAMLVLALLSADVLGARGQRPRFRCRTLPAAAHCCPARSVAVEQEPSRGTSAQTPWRSLFDGRTLTGWEVADEFEYRRHGEVAVVEGTLQMRMGSPSTGVRYAAEQELPRMNYELALQARRIDGVDFFCGLTFPIGEKYCTLIIGGWSGTVVGLSNVDGMAAADNVTTLLRQFETDRWYDIRLRVSEHRVTVWIDGEAVIDLATEGREFDIWWEKEPMRPLGLANWFTASQLRQIRLRLLSEEEVSAGEQPAAE